MSSSTPNSKTKSKILFASTLVAVMVVSLILGFFSGQIVEQNQNSALQSRYDSLQVNYNQIQSNYENIRAQLSTLQLQLNNLQDNLLNQSGTGTPGGVESISILSVLVSGRVIDVLANSKNGLDVYITSITLKDAAGNIVAADNSSSITLPGSGVLTDIKVDFASANLSSGVYTVTLVSAKGNSFLSSPFIVS